MPKIKRNSKKIIKKPRKKIHDSTYKLIFSNAEAFAALLRCFVPMAPLLDFDYSTLEKVSESHISSHLSQRIDDIIWRLKSKNNSWYYVYVITEFQTTNDKWMAARMAKYVAELRMELIRSHIVNDDELLPPILPIVLYNGVSRWTASKTLNSIQVALPEPLALPDTKEEYV
ncbi:MAG: Rpn family recombination-promoting nuclease/putative transposase, partial [Desulfovibrionaceae bacterium]|nr:Rpn family recombination-promoting nuclease/putative transposase [Desulfovibrionaceae bacterium]